MINFKNQLTNAFLMSQIQDTTQKTDFYHILDVAQDDELGLLFQW